MTTPLEAPRTFSSNIMHHKIWYAILFKTSQYNKNLSEIQNLFAANRQTSEYYERKFEMY